MDPDDIKAYANRSWAAVTALKQDHWADEFVRRGPAATFEASGALWVHMRALRPEWPSDGERQADLAQHVELKRLIDLAAGVCLAHTRR